MKKQISTLEKETVLKMFQKIPSVGKACAMDLWNMGFRQIDELEGKNPLHLYQQLNTITNQTHDICMLYTFRCMVYFATEKKHDKEKLKWWYWKDKTYNEKKGSNE
jgi:Pathogenicity locus